ncbi:Putative DNA-binding domain-containing protein [Devosia enhydra]|uniref:Putative DNA-binding domain-containing protein n=1 Tax=Devosia enhydra TaxID=665118 RepID=A0A1K2HWT6_9HYPH|nr:putative DNA-binding domain-containing protein [Devosia enhydra]SFZ83523.1 Putative DNA-binding domain-containing protein [Devosia enhydra]
MSAQHAFASALVSPDLPPPAGLTTRGGPVDPLRFAVYRNTVHVTLVRALEARFPVTRRVVGAEFFAGMARLHVGHCKPGSPLLARYGDDFPAFVESFPPAAGLPWLPDLMALECAWTQSYHAAESLPLTLQDLACFPTDRLPDLAFVAHPATRLIVSGWPVGSIWSAHQVEPVAPISAREAETVLVTRPDADVTLRVLPSGDKAFADALIAGRTIGAAATASPPADIGAALIGLVTSGAFTSAHLAEETSS